jgi:two-component system chemotaxis response regulator CheY
MAPGPPIAMNILVADDEPRYRDLMAILFEKWPEHTVTLAADGHEAWVLLSDPERKFDAAFLDINMPRMSGLDVLRRMAESDRHRAVEAVMCTARNDRATITEAIGLGARHYLIKPWNETVIAAKLQLIAASRNTRSNPG